MTLEPDPPRVLTMTDPTRLSLGGATFDGSVVPWDSKTFGFQVAEIDNVHVPERSSHREGLVEFDDWCRDNDIRLVSCRLGHSMLRESMHLEAHGFRFVEMVYSPLLPSLEAIGQPLHAIGIVEATDRDIRQIEEIAATAFATGRFLLDWRLDPSLSHQRYSNWVRSSHSDPSHALLKAELDGDLIGFFIVERRKDDSVYWHLTAVSPEQQGRGIGMSLWRTMLLRHRLEGMTAVETTISAHNTAALNLYARLGFSFAKPQITLHWTSDLTGTVEVVRSSRP